jgi:predicted nucleic acid-binding protein
VPRIVADTNIYISALNFAGTADEVLALGRAGLVEICISRAILDEIWWRSDSQVPLVLGAAGADAIVTGDHHLLELRQFGSARIMTPRGFLDAESRR